MYILGNGFDVAHGLKTSYRNFRCYLQKLHPSLLLKLGEFYDVDEDAELWKTFESTIGQMDVEMIEKQFSEPNYASDDFRDGDYEDNAILVDNEIDFIDELKDTFAKWIASIRSGILSDKRFEFELPAKFITFNYTHTLELLYRINPENILHIHGQVGQKIIFGHAVDAYRWKMTRMYGSDYENIDSSEWPEIARDFAIEKGYDALERKLNSLCKKPDINIKNCLDFLSKLEGIERIVILGATLTNGDDDYIRYLNNYLGTSVQEWLVYYFFEYEKDELKTIMINSGVDERKLLMLPSKGLVGNI